METILLDAGDVLSPTMKRIKGRLGDGQLYAMLVEWAGHLRITRGLSPHSCANYLDGVAQFMAWLSGRGVDVGAATAAVIEEWLQSLYLENREAGKTRALKLTAVKQFYTWREANGGGINPARAMKGPRKERRIPRKYTKGQLQGMFASCNRDTVKGRRDFALLLFMYATGARRGEMVGLEIEQMVLNELTGAVRFFGKGAKERVLTFEGAVVDAMKAWLVDRDNLDLLDRDAVFVGLSGRSKGQRLVASGLAGVIGNAARTARVKDARSGDLALHKMRATFATDLYDLGEDVRAIQLLMGHEDINTTMQYIAISNKQTKVRMPRDRINELTGGF